jgi:hypothetical protein
LIGKFFKKCQNNAKIMLAVEQALGLGRSVTTEAEQCSLLALVEISISRFQGKLDSTSLTRRHSTRVTVSPRMEDASLSAAGVVFQRCLPALEGGSFASFFVYFPREQSGFDFVDEDEDFGDSDLPRDRRMARYKKRL